MRIYISGPITGTTDYKERFAAAEEKLEANGYEVVNPVRLAEALPETLTHFEHLSFDVVALMLCDSVYMLNMWQYSQGATYERNLSLLSEKKIIYEDGDAT